MNFCANAGKAMQKLRCHEMQKNAKMQSVQVWIADGYETRKE